MSCCHYYALAEGKESAFSIDISSITFGPSVLGELGEHARSLGMTRVALFTDKHESIHAILTSLIGLPPLLSERYLACGETRIIIETS